MTKYFELLLDLLEIKKTDKIIQVAKIIESNQDKDIEVYHQLWFIFDWYKKLLAHEIELEDFLQIWDFQSKVKINQKDTDSISFLKWNPSLDDEKIYIFDSISEWILPEKRNVCYC